MCGEDDTMSRWHIIFYSIWDCISSSQPHKNGSISVSGLMWRIYYTAHFFYCIQLFLLMSHVPQAIFTLLWFMGWLCVRTYFLTNSAIPIYSEILLSIPKVLKYKSWYSNQDYWRPDYSQFSQENTQPQAEIINRGAQNLYNVPTQNFSHISST